MPKVKLIFASLMMLALSIAWEESQAQNLARSEVKSEEPSQLIATSMLWIDRDREEIRVYRNGVLMELPAGFHELVVADTIPAYPHLDRLVGKSVALVRSLEHACRLDIFVGVGGGRRGQRLH